MTLHVVAGAAWGDEGKGKIVDYFAGKTDLCLRLGGGPNAGHTVVIDGEIFGLHQLPVGILRQGCLNALGPAVYVNPMTLEKELKIAERFGSIVCLDERAHIILPLHIAIDEAREMASGPGAIGTTKCGIGPLAEDIMARRGPVLGDLRSEDRLRDALLARNFFAERSALLNYYGCRIPSLEETIGWCMQFASEIVSRFCDTTALVRQTSESGGEVLIELAQGVMLDIYQGTYPFVTSSLCTPAAVAATIGVYQLDRVTMVSKAYITRVGNGSFPTLITDERQQLLVERGKEIGVTTGRVRQCGWLDLPLLRYSCRGGTEIALTKLDLLSGIGPIPVCDEYRDDRGMFLEEGATLTEEFLSQVKPRYIVLPGWDEEISGCRNFSDLPQNAKNYVTYIEEHVGLPVSIIGVGRGREDICHRNA